MRATLTNMKVVEMAAQVNQEAAFLRGMARLFVLRANAHGSVDYEPLLATAWWRRHRRPAPTRWKLRTTRCHNDGPAARGTTAGLLYFPVFNYSHGDLSQIHTELQHPRTMMSLADGGAHVGYVCDVSMPTFMLTHWHATARAWPKLPLELLVKKQTRDTAQVYGLNDRGLFGTGGMKADVNIIDFTRLQLDLPHFVFDLPAGGRRLTQSAQGYIATLVSGEATFEQGQPTGAMPGRLVRGPATRLNWLIPLETHP